MNLPDTMTAMVTKGHGDLDQMVLHSDRPRSTPAAKEVLIKVGAPVKFPCIQGADVCGEIVAIGANVDAARVRERVITDGWLRDADVPNEMSKTDYFGPERDGGFAQYATTSSRNALAIQSDLSDAELATFSCAYSTAEGMLTGDISGGRGPRNQNDHLHLPEGPGLGIHPDEKTLADAVAIYT